MTGKRTGNAGRESKNDPGYIEALPSDVRKRLEAGYDASKSIFSFYLSMRANFSERFVKIKGNKKMVVDVVLNPRPTSIDDILLVEFVSVKDGKVPFRAAKRCLPFAHEDIDWNPKFGGPKKED